MYSNLLNRVIYIKDKWIPKHRWITGEKAKCFVGESEDSYPIMARAPKVATVGNNVEHGPVEAMEMGKDEANSFGGTSEDSG